MLAESAVAPSSMPAPAMALMPPTGYPSGSRTARPRINGTRFTKGNWQETLQAPPRPLNAVHPVREISPRLAASIAQTHESSMRRQQTPAAAAQRRAELSTLQPYAPLLPRITPLSVTM